MVALLALVACATPAAPGSTAIAATAAAPKPATLADFGWLVGSWHDATAEVRWQVVATALYGVVLRDTGFEVNIIDDSDDDGNPAPISMISLDGKHARSLPHATATPERIELSGTTDGHARSVRLRKMIDALRGESYDREQGQPERHPVVFDMHPGGVTAGPALEAADLQFAADTANDGAEAWVRWFAALSCATPPAFGVCGWRCGSIGGKRWYAGS